MLRINDIAPNFDAQHNNRENLIFIFFRKFLGNLFSHPKDFTPVCTTELGYMAKIENEFSLKKL